MSLNRNTPRIYDKFRSQANGAPSVEDGNGVDETLQGKILTSEIGTSDGYSVDYSAQIISVVANSLGGSTGNAYTYTVTLSYTIELFPGATIPGLYGDNLLDNGTPFIIGSSNVVRGTVNRIISAAPPIAAPPYYTYTLVLDCTFTEGDPFTVSAGEKFIWKLNLYNEQINFESAYPPVGLESSYNKSTGEVFFYWKNINELSFSYNIQIRELGTFPSTAFEYVYVPGNTANPVTQLQPFVTPGGVITTIKIVTPGIDCNSERSLEFVGPGTGESWATRLDNEGALFQTEFELYALNNAAGVIRLFSRTLLPNGVDYPVPTLGSYVGGLAAVGGNSDFYVHAVAQVVPGSNRRLNVTVRNAHTGASVVFPPAYSVSRAVTHDGVYRLTTGSGYNSKLRANVKKIPPAVKYYYDPTVYSFILPNRVYAWKVSANLARINNKNFTEWTDETIIKT